MTRTFIQSTAIFSIFVFLGLTSYGVEIHVSPTGKDSNAGTKDSPLRTIQQAADRAMPGDVVTVHGGVYRERINPPRGGESDEKRIVYQAAPGETVVIKGSEIVGKWTKVQNETWKTTVPNSMFGDFNPFTTPIQGDWFDPRGRNHHVGAVYRNGDQLIEAATLDDVLQPWGNKTQSEGPVLLNITWLQLEANDNKRIAATKFAEKSGTQNAPCSEGGECVGWIRQGCELRYDHVDFGKKTENLLIRAASESTGGIIDLRIDEPKGKVIGSCTVPNTGGWQSWQSFPVKIQATSGVKTLYLTFRETPNRLDPGFWFAETTKDETTIWAQFEKDPNGQVTEINVRQSIFYPDHPGCNYITVRGFAMRHAATPWAPPTAEQIGLIGTHWSKGWIIENNIISHSTCCGITLGKHGDEFDNTSANSAEGYVETIKRAHGFQIPWTKEHVGGHVVRNNTISHCEQAGIVGSMGCAFSLVEDNTIHDIHVRRLFSGAEMAGIKFHGAIDTIIRRNHIYRNGCFGLWLDWMTQGTRVSSNVFHENGQHDLFVEVNHGPFVVDNNLFFSPKSLLSVSQGGAYVHNLFSGGIDTYQYDARLTPYHQPHSTEVLGLHDNPRGDDRFVNNIFLGLADLRPYDVTALPMIMEGNVFADGAKPSKHEMIMTTKLTEQAGGFSIDLPSKKTWNAHPARKLVTTEMLGETAIAKAAFENPDGSPIRFDVDFFGNHRDTDNPVSGPFENAEKGSFLIAKPAAE